MPKVSVIVPIYNAERFLDDSLESLRRQTMPDFEALLIDDGSTDSSPAIMKRFVETDSRFRVIRRENGGLSAARNTGIDAAKGEWIYFLDADDTIRPDTLTLLLQCAARYKAPMVVCGFFEADKENWPERSERNEGQKDFVWEPPEALRIALYQRRRINNAAGTLYAASLFHKSGLRFEEGCYYEDLLIFPNLCLEAGRIAYCPEPLYFYRQHPQSFIHRFSPHRLDSLLVTEEILSLVRERMPQLEGAARDRQMSAAFNVLLLLERYHPEGELPERYHRFGHTYAEVGDWCRRLIGRQRWRSLFGRGVRLKNRVGALLSLGGRPILSLFASKVN